MQGFHNYLFFLRINFIEFKLCKKLRFDVRVSTMASTLNLLNQVFCFAFKINSKYNFIKTLFDAELSTQPNQLVNYSKSSLISSLNLYSRLYYNYFITPIHPNLYSRLYYNYFITPVHPN